MVSAGLKRLLGADQLARQQLRRKIVFRLHRSSVSSYPQAANFLLDSDSNGTLRVEIPNIRL
jgi:hypothetical protein